MKLILKYTVIIVIMIFLSCSTNKENFKKETFKLGYNTYEIILPRENYTEKLIDNGGESIEIRIVFSDSTIIFITNSKSATPLVNKFLTPSDYLKFIDEENLKYEFTENGSLHFLEKRGNIFIGYVNVQKISKPKYDSILSSIKKR